MGYKIIKYMGCPRVKKFGKYKIGVYDHKICDGSIIDKGCCVIFYKGIFFGSLKYYDIRKITFDSEKRSIILESRKSKKGKFRKQGLENITNKEFYEYTRKNVEKLFGTYYNVIPNDDRTEFKLIKKDNHPWAI